jgi:secondary thiamine-phosphate synthase enzyme
VIELEIATTARIEARDITELVQERARAAGDGFLWASCPHTTAALLLCESDPEMLRDLERVAEDLLGPLAPFQHNKNNNPNAPAHLFSSLMGTQLLLPFEGQVLLGTYQRIIFLELDGPRTRRVQLKHVRLPSPPGQVINLPPPLGEGRVGAA